ncbi:hypothetical protein N7495_007127 [Penicillium taxi]|uniref:uncharacterized protein n=1 Tax=Penicillium taxi TaxID=168475 RepID=UPI0025453239|nr:uncharacterized protein N7495_007127 [Penicillium taxi]KAJ5895436.1 hypothetical protein N7495_007127 [Penicillium taxi]
MRDGGCTNQVAMSEWCCLSQSRNAELSFSFGDWSLPPPGTNAAAAMTHEVIVHETGVVVGPTIIVPFFTIYDRQAGPAEHDLVLGPGDFLEITDGCW